MKLRVTAALAICVVRLLGFVRIFKAITVRRLRDEYEGNDLVRASMFDAAVRNMDAEGPILIPTPAKMRYMMAENSVKVLAQNATIFKRRGLVGSLTFQRT